MECGHFHCITTGARAPSTSNGFRPQPMLYSIDMASGVKYSVLATFSLARGCIIIIIKDLWKIHSMQLAFNLVFKSTTWTWQWHTSGTHAAQLRECTVVQASRPHCFVFSLHPFSHFLYIGLGKVHEYCLSFGIATHCFTLRAVLFFFFLKLVVTVRVRR